MGQLDYCVCERGSQKTPARCSTDEPATPPSPPTPPTPESIELFAGAHATWSDTMGHTVRAPQTCYTRWDCGLLEAAAKSLLQFLHGTQHLIWFAPSDTAACTHGIRFDGPWSQEEETCPFSPRHISLYRSRGGLPVCLEPKGMGAMLGWSGRLQEAKHSARGHRFEDAASEDMQPCMSDEQSPQGSGLW